MDDKLYIKKFIRDDGERLSFDGEQLYLAQENTLLVRPDPSTTAVNFTEADGGEMIRQQNTTYDQPVNGLIIPKSTDYWTLTKQLSLFFKVNHTYKIIYVKKDGSMFKVSNAWISSGLQIVPVPHEEYSRWSITMTIGNVNWTEYAENSQGDEIYSNTITLPLISAATGGEEWEYEAGEEVSGEGSEIELETSAGATVDDLEIKGDTFQQTYSGKNKFKVPDGTITNNNIVWTRSDGVITGNGTTTSTFSTIVPNDTNVLPTPLPAGTYTFSRTVASKYVLEFVHRDSNNTLYNGLDYRIMPNETSKTFTVDHDIAKVGIALLKNTEESNLGTLTNVSFEAQLEAGSTPTSYEPYTGGASPNPDYPQDIDVVTGEQNVWVHGKNLFDKTLTPRSSNYSTASQITNGIRVASTRDATGSSFYVLYLLGNTKDYIGKTLTLSANMQASASNVPRVMLGLCDSSGGNASGKVNIYNNGSVSYQVENDTTRQYLFLAIYSTAGGTVQVGDYVDYTKIQLEVNSSPTTYEPYQSQSYTVDLGSTELCKIGDYQDYIYKSGDDWYVHKECGNRQLTTVTGTYSNAGSGYIGAYYNNAGMLPNSRTNGFSNRFSAQFSPVGSTTEAITYGTTGSDQVIIILNSSRMASSTIANWESWLANNETVLYYALATPTDTKITDNTLIGELEALHAAEGYNNKTIISVSATGTNLPAILAVTLQNPPIKGEVWDNVGTVWELGSGGTQTVNIDSTTTVYPVWVVEGPCVNPTLQNNTTDTIAQYDGTVAAGQTLTVNFEEGTAYLDSALVTRYVTGLVSLRPGENTVGFNSDGGDTETSIISWNNVIN